MTQTLIDNHDMEQDTEVIQWYDVNKLGNMKMKEDA